MYSPRSTSPTAPRVSRRAPGALDRESLLAPLRLGPHRERTELLRQEFADVRDDVRRLMERAESRDGEPLEPGEVGGAIRDAFRAARLADTPAGGFWRRASRAPTRRAL